MAERSRRPRVILADDYEGIRKAMACLLAPACDVVGCVSDGAELFHAIEVLRPDVVILDLNLPGIDGLDACRQIKAAAADLDVIVCTAAHDADLRARALEAGASGFVVKVRVGDELLAAIQRTRSSGLLRPTRCGAV
jgi:DNA-binding NarL/FixJ family response regulator